VFAVMVVRDITVDAKGLFERLMLRLLMGEVPLLLALGWCLFALWRYAGFSIFFFFASALSPSLMPASRVSRGSSRPFRASIMQRDTHVSVAGAEAYGWSKIRQLFAPNGGIDAFLKRYMFIMLAIAFTFAVSANIGVETIVSRRSATPYQEPPLIDIGFLLLAYAFVGHVFRLPFVVFFVFSSVCTLEYLLVIFIARPFPDSVNEAYFGMLALMGMALFWKVRVRW
jgi:hypothetical protein